MQKLATILNMSIIPSTVGPTVSSYGPGSFRRIMAARRASWFEKAQKRRDERKTEGGEPSVSSFPKRDFNEQARTYTDTWHRG
jgi:hypothetical protein